MSEKLRIGDVFKVADESGVSNKIYEWKGEYDQNEETRGYKVYLWGSGESKIISLTSHFLKLEEV